MSAPTDARPLAIEAPDVVIEAPDVVIEALADAIYSCDSAPLLNARTVPDRWAAYQAQARNIAWPMLRAALVTRPEVLRAPAGVPTADVATPRGVCPVCGEVVSLVLDVHGHFGPGVETEDETFCDASHAAPEGVDAADERMVPLAPLRALARDWRSSVHRSEGLELDACLDELAGPSDGMNVDAANELAAAPDATAIERDEAARTVVRTEWAVQYRGAAISNYGENEQAARFYVETPPVEGYQLVRREVRTTAWAPVDETEDGGQDR